MSTSISRVTEALPKGLPISGLFLKLGSKSSTNRLTEKVAQLKDSNVTVFLQYEPQQKFAVAEMLMQLNTQRHEKISQMNGNFIDRHVYMIKEATTRC